VPFSLVSVEDEIAIGREAQAQVRADLRELTDPQVTRYVRTIGERLVAAAPGPEYPYSFSVADAAEINAFALPGGPVWVHRGILQAAENESQLAAVLAHEVAHVTERHAAGQLTKGIVTNIGLGLLGAILGNATGASAAQAAAGLLADGAFLKFSRDDEREADRVGLALVHRAGWDGRGMIEMFEILQREGDRNPSAVETFFSSHPAPGDRSEGLRASVAEFHGGTRDTREFRAVKARLASLPAAPRPAR
jgi:predicted Zn-dependent protease